MAKSDLKTGPPGVPKTGARTARGDTLGLVYTLHETANPKWRFGVQEILTTKAGLVQEGDRWDCMA